MSHCRIESSDAIDAYDAKGLLKTAIRDENPVVFFRNKMMYKLKGPVPEESHDSVGVADVKRKARHHDRGNEQHVQWRWVRRSCWKRLA